MHMSMHVCRRVGTRSGRVNLSTPRSRKVEQTQAREDETRTVFNLKD